MSRSKHGKRRNKHKRSNPCSPDCWICMSGAEKKRRVLAQADLRTTGKRGGAVNE